ncbi:hypothetical protein [Brevundimonas sp.]|uniref:hypothetical protein n=1 Tax=Brevundimonas sp. TaxID=1871086 RepID=UPI002D65B8EF|nr:hypothetical protein [Brevundimonas sp.]HYD26979.1 hypothetical protein [Brevundimonas sp.]
MTDLIKRLAVASAEHAAAVTALVKFPSRPVPQTLIARVDAANKELQALAGDGEAAPEEKKPGRKGREKPAPEVAAPASASENVQPSAEVASPLV